MQCNTTNNKMTELLSHAFIWINHKILCQIKKKKKKKKTEKNENRDCLITYILNSKKYKQINNGRK